MTCREIYSNLNRTIKKVLFNHTGTRMVRNHFEHCVSAHSTLQSEQLVVLYHRRNINKNQLFFFSATESYPSVCSCDGVSVSVLVHVCARTQVCCMLCLYTAQYTDRPCSSLYLVVAVAIIITQKRHIYFNVKIETKENSRIDLQALDTKCFRFYFAK